MANESISTIGNMMKLGQVGPDRPYSKTSTMYGSAEDKWKAQAGQGNIPMSVENARTIEDRGRGFDDDDTNDDLRRKMTAEQMQAMNELHADLFQEIMLAGSDNERRYFTFEALARIVDFGDDFNGRILRERLAAQCIKGNDAIRSLRGDLSPTKERQKNIEESLQLVEDVDKVFDRWFGQYRYLSMSTKIFQTAFSDIPEFMNPKVFARIYGEMPGFKEGEAEWPSMSDQIDVILRAYTYLALQSDPRWKDDLDLFRKSAGFRKLFPNAASEREWLLRTKLATLPNEYDEAAPLYGKKYEQLTPTDIATLDKLPAFNRFADAANEGSMIAIKNAVEEIARQGKNSDDPALIRQSQIAETFAKQTFLMFGMAGMYGSRGLAFDREGNATEAAFEAGPWNDTSSDAMRPRDRNVYNEQSNYWYSSAAWHFFAPEHVMVDFLRMLPVRDKVHPQSKADTRSAYELWLDGKSIGDVMKDSDHLPDWGYRAFLIRYLFTFKEDSGALSFMSGALLDSKVDFNSRKYWIEGQKSIHIVCRDWVITKGKYKEFFADTENVKKVEEIAKARKLDTSNPEDLRKAQGLLIKEKIVRTKNRWKAFAYLAALERVYFEPGKLEGLKGAINGVSETKAGYVYLPKKLLEQKVNFNDKKSISAFLDTAENWPLDNNFKVIN